MTEKFSNRSISDMKTDKQTKGVKTLLGDPKKAVIKLAVPMIIAMSVTTIYNFVDALWVSGFGVNYFTSVDIPETGKGALAAIGFVFPFFMMAMAIATGLGVGSGSAISRRIGAGDKEGADNVAIHSIIITIIIAIVFSILLYAFSDRIFVLIGAGDAASMAVSYGRIIFACSIVIFFSYIANAILRGEGDAKRAMYAMMLGAVINIILDPIFIYTFGLGVTGAAYATVISMGLTSLILIYWLFFRKDTYVSFKFCDFKFNKEILIDIFRVGIPASFQQISMAITMIIMIKIISMAGGGDDGVAVYQTGWRVVMIAVLPLLGMATAVVSVTAAAFGECAYKKLNTAYMYAIKFGLIIEIIIAILTFVLAPFIAGMFTTGPGGADIAPDLEMFIKISCLFYPGAALGIASSALFQGTGKGTYALVATLLRTILLTVVLALVFVYAFNLSLVGIWWAIVIANLLGSVVAFSWGRLYIRGLTIQLKTVS